jgi:hypothetical protein
VAGDQWEDAALGLGLRDSSEQEDRNLGGRVNWSGHHALAES